MTIRPEPDPMVKPVTLGEERLGPDLEGTSIGVEGDHWKGWLRTVDAGINRAAPVTERKKSRRPAPTGVVGSRPLTKADIALNRGLSQVVFGAAPEPE